jgi:hypothetical protein
MLVTSAVARANERLLSDKPSSARVVSLRKHIFDLSMTALRLSTSVPVLVADLSNAVITSAMISATRGPVDLVERPSSMKSTAIAAVLF